MVQVRVFDSQARGALLRCFGSSDSSSLAEEEATRQGQLIVLISGMEAGSARATCDIAMTHGVVCTPPGSFSSGYCTFTLRSTESTLRRCLPDFFPDFSDVAAMILAQLPPEEAGVIELPRLTLDLTRRPLVQGILNITPDSFYDGSRHNTLERALAHAAGMLEDGADIIDVGGESTRPGAKEVADDEEIARVVPVISELAKRTSIPISIDTTKGSVARAAIDAGAQIINDVSGLASDSSLGEVAARHKVGLILMHMRGTPRTMQHNTRYDTLMGEIVSVLREAAEKAVKAGVDRGRIVVDPGIGFAKSAQDNLVILRQIGVLRSLGYPVLVGASRKSFLGRIFGWELEERLHGSVAAACYAVLAGASIVRVHDVAETRPAVDTVWQINRACPDNYPEPIGGA